MLYPWIFFFQSGYYSCVTLLKVLLVQFCGALKRRYFFSKWCNYSTKWCCKTRILLDVTLYFTAKVLLLFNCRVTTCFSFCFLVCLILLFMNESNWRFPYCIYICRFTTYRNQIRKEKKEAFLWAFFWRKWRLFCWEVVTVGGNSDCLELQKITFGHLFKVM